MRSIITRFEDDMDRVTNKMVFVQKGVDKLLKQKGEMALPRRRLCRIGRMVFRRGSALRSGADTTKICFVVSLGVTLIVLVTVYFVLP